MWDLPGEEFHSAWKNVPPTKSHGLEDIRTVKSTWCIVYIQGGIYREGINKF